MNQEELKRLVNKSDRQQFINDLNTGFGLSKVEAEALYDRVTLFNRDYYDGARQRIRSDSKNSGCVRRTSREANKALSDGIGEFNPFT